MNATLLLAMLLIIVCVVEAAPLRLWYDQPAENWNEALPIGNGRLGAMVFGGVEAERLQLNEDTLWSGFPHDYANPEAARWVPEVQKALFEGRYADANTLTGEHLMGNPKFQQSYQPLGDLLLSYPARGKLVGIKRELDLADGLASTVVWREGHGNCQRREYFSSHPDQVLVVRLTDVQAYNLYFDARLDCPHPHQVRVEGNDQLVMTGQWLGTSQGGELTAPVEGGGLRFEFRLLAIPEGGTVTADEEGLHIERALTVTLLIAAATSFVRYDDISGDASAKCKAYLDAARQHSYYELRDRHLADYKSLFDRVALSLGPGADSVPTDQRLRRVAEGQSDPALAALYFQYGRYLMLSSSRPGDQPANLQGLWNESTSPPWGSKYTVNINTEMNYWLPEVAALPECHEPLFSMLKDLSETGGRVAKEHYGCGGWVLHHNTDLWRGAAPVDGPWGITPTEGAWLATHIFEHYAFTQDEPFLREAWPVLKGAAEFLLDFLVEEPTHGWLVTAPSASPENRFRAPDGQEGYVCASPTMDLGILRELFSDCIQATQVLKKDKAFARQLEAALERLAPYQIGKYGQLQEWLEDFDEPEPGHRHMSNLWPLFPGSQFTPERQPELYEAARKSLERRLANGGGHTGWSRAWIICLWARLRDGEKVAENVNALLGKSTLPSLLDNHPPFQIDGNFGGAAGMAEALLQSQNGVIELLPALPPEWPSGWARGLRARGGFEVSLKWHGGALERAEITSVAGQPLTLGYAGKQYKITLAEGATFRFEPE